MDRLAAVALSTLLLLTAMAPAATANDSGEFQLVQAEWPVELQDSTTYVLEGTMLADGYCRYDYPDGVMTEDDVWHYTRIVGVNPDGCRQLIEEGTAKQPPTYPEGNEFAHATATAAEIDTNVSVVPETVGGRKRATHNVQWVDPLLLAVNWVRNTTTFTYDTTCAGDGSSVGAFDWLWETGWYRKSWSVTQSGSPICEWWQGQSKATYQNDVFCAFQTTQAVYDYVRVKGWFNGSVTFSRSTFVNGGCTNLLHMEFSTSVTKLW